MSTGTDDELAGLLFPVPDDAEVEALAAEAPPLDEGFAARATRKALLKMKVVPPAPSAEPASGGVPISVSLACTYCHDRLRSDEAAYCASCLAPHHPACFAQHARCSAPGCVETQLVFRRPPPRRRGRGRLLLAASLVGAGALGAAAWSLVGGPAPKVAPPRPAPPRVAERIVIARPEELLVEGRVVDERGAPLADVHVRALIRQQDGRVVEQRTLAPSQADGSFAVLSRQVTGATELELEHPDGARELRAVVPLDSLGALPRQGLEVVLKARWSLGGTLLDATGAPAAGVLVEAYGYSSAQRRATRTDPEGRFLLEGLPSLVTVRAHDLGRQQRVKRLVELAGDRRGVSFQLEAAPRPAGLTVLGILGMTLAEITPELAALYDLHHDHGVVVLDPGPDSERFGVGALHEGDHLWIVGLERPEAEVLGLRDLVESLLADPVRPRFVYCFRAEAMKGTNTQMLRLTGRDVEELRATLARGIPDAPPRPEPAGFRVSRDPTCVLPQDALAVTRVRRMGWSDRPAAADVELDLTGGATSEPIDEIVGTWRLGSHDEAWLSVWTRSGGAGAVCARGQGSFRILVHAPQSYAEDWSTLEVSFRPARPAERPRATTFSRLVLQLLEPPD